MRINKTLSTTLLAAMIAFSTGSYLQAQDNQFKSPPMRPIQGAQAAKFLPPASAAPQTKIRPVAFLQDQKDVKVPSILGGQKPAPATSAPVTPALTGPSASNSAPRISAQAAAETTAKPMKNQPKDDQQVANAFAHPSRQQIQQRPVRQASLPTTMQATRTERAGWQSQPLRNSSAIAQETASFNQSTESPTTNIDTSSLIQTASPKIDVQTIGPATISIGKIATYEVLVHNNGKFAAENMIVGIDFPTFVEINNSQPSVGHREITDGTQESRMIWDLPIVEAGATEKITIDVLPNEARPFDVNVEWTFKPIIGKTKIEVTEPKLAVQIAGPNEVQFGEKALYNVTVSNPGTGIAENVTVMLPEALGGERASLQNIEPGAQRLFQVELIARSAGTLELTTTATADGNISEAVARTIMVRRAELDAQLTGPAMKYASSAAKYKLKISNIGDAMAKDVIAAVALPSGVEYISGIDAVENIEGGIRWNVGMLSPGNERIYEIVCSVNQAGEIQIEAATRGAGDLAATDDVVTTVEAVADLVLSVQDPKGPLPTGENIDYEIKIVNRGTKAARDVKIVMQFGEGVEPISAKGLSSEIMTGQVLFTPISQIEPNQEIVLTITAAAQEAGPHRFRAQLICEESEAHEVSEGTTKFFGDTNTAPDRNTESDGQFKR